MATLTLLFMTCSDVIYPGETISNMPYRVPLLQCPRDIPSLAHLLGAAVFPLLSTYVIVAFSLPTTGLLAPWMLKQFISVSSAVSRVLDKPQWSVTAVWLLQFWSKKSSSIRVVKYHVAECLWSTRGCFSPKKYTSTSLLASLSSLGEVRLTEEYKGI